MGLSYGIKALLFDANELPIDTYNSLNFGNNAHWTSKPNCPEGRFLFDPNNPADGFTGLNTKEGLEIIRSIYGDMTFPTIQEFLLMIYEVSHRKKCKLIHLRIWKEDVKGAFAQSNIDPKDAWLSAMNQLMAQKFLLNLFGPERWLQIILLQL